MKGETGPTGPAKVDSFGQINSGPVAGPVEVPVTANTPAVVPLSIPIATSNEGKDPEKISVEPNKITIADEGYYMLNYSVYPLFVATAATDLTFAVRSNGVNIPQTVSTASAPAATFNASYSGSAIVKLPAGAVIDVIVNSTSGLTMHFDNSEIGSLIVYKID